jgi:hypothetical protein
MYQEILRNIAGVGVFPTISLVLFVAVFTVMLVGVLRMDRRQADRHASIALDDNSGRGGSNG